MKKGDLVYVAQKLGVTRTYRTRGCGIVLSVTEGETLKFGEHGTEAYLGDEITVALTSGEVEVFHPESVALLDERK